MQEGVGWINSRDEHILVGGCLPTWRIAETLGSFRKAIGFSEHAHVILDAHGVVQWIKVYPVGESPDLQEVFQVLKNLDS